MFFFVPHLYIIGGTSLLGFGSFIADSDQLGEAVGGIIGVTLAVYRRCQCVFRVSSFRDMNDVMGVK